MFLFADQLEYDEPMQEKVQGMAQFLLLFYVVAWLRAPVAEDAPANDLNLYRSLVRHRQLDQPVANAALAVMRRHLWYLQPSVVVFSLFSSRVTEEEKEAICVNLLANSCSAAPDQTPSVALDESTSLSELVTTSSWLMFDLMGVDHEWMTKQPPGEWEGHEAYILCKEFVKTVKVVNDTAERGIALLKTFAQHVKGQDQFQWLLQAVERHRRAVPHMTKAALATL
ncbi:hypothetical protein FJT64_018407 [Amphibalanus amphitrite]|uniref:Uncharacterized protein n=1 Tax=Amphibalanus amphitrite TaxID=1232801 RepID=A0A6A4X881_AMPAM|nr:hypothetical protein FJT64_018407 [Amphibalanus amphitrite]